MNSFGQIKTKIEKVFSKGHYDKDFKKNIKEFKKHVLDQKQIAEAYFLYDELSSQKGLSESVVDDYISESFEHLKNIIDTNKKKIQDLSEWIDSILKESVNNDYTDIDNQIYTKNVVKNLESLIESKQRIRKNLMTTKVVKENKSVNLPLSSMLKIANSTFNKEFKNLNEEEKKEFKHLTSLKGEKLTEEINNVKNSVIEKLTKNLNESKESDLTEKIQATINKINESEETVSSLYKLQQLNKGL
jgi:DNA-binding transcriptional regulator GbsR (MarR family)